MVDCYIDINVDRKYLRETEDFNSPVTKFLFNLSDILNKKYDGIYRISGSCYGAVRFTDIKKAKEARKFLMSQTNFGFQSGPVEVDLKYHVDLPLLQFLGCRVHFSKDDFNGTFLRGPLIDIFDKMVGPTYQ